MVSIEISTDIACARGLRAGDGLAVFDLCETWRAKSTRNALRSNYYRMHRRARDLGISIPPELRNLEQACGWPVKAVDSLGARSQFDGFTCADEDVCDELAEIMDMTGLKRKYRQAVRSELTHSCAFLTVTAGDESAGEPPVVVNAYPATSAAAIWDRPRNRIKCGMVVVDSDRRTGKPTWVDVYTETNVIRIRRGPRGIWEAAYSEDFEMGRCLMERLAYDADLDRPFGRSRISRSVMCITDNAMRAALRSEVSAEFFTAPQKYLLGADKDALGGKTKWDAYIGNIFAVSRDGNGDIPQFGQLTQGSMQPHIDYMRSLAARFSGETNVPLSELGVVSDNPSSAEAIYAAKEALVVEAQNLNADNGEALAHVALMALAIKEGTTYAEQAARRLRICPKFRNPAMPSVVTQADAMLKDVQAVPWLAESDVLLEELGFSDDQIQRLRSDRDRATSRALVAAATSGTGIDLPTANPAAAGALLDGTR